VIPSLDLDTFLHHFKQQWRLDQHVSLIGPVGRGKSYVARKIITQRPGETVVMCPKGVDATMQGFGHRITKWPPPWLTPEADEKTGQRILRLEPPVNKHEDLAKVRVAFARAMRDGFRKGHITHYIDELQVAADPKMMGLGKLIEANILMGRSRNLSVVSSIQVPRWAPRAAYDQASHVLLWRQRDRPAMQRIAEISGVDTRMVQQEVRGLAYHSFLWVDTARDKLFIVEGPKDCEHCRLGGIRG
jgi:hypothetical protein